MAARFERTRVERDLEGASNLHAPEVAEVSETSQKIVAMRA